MTLNLVILARRMKWELIITTCLFVVGALGGIFFSQDLIALLHPMLSSLEQKAALMRQETANQLMVSLFNNNLIVSLMMLLGGFILGILPVIYVFLNGALVGYVISTVSSVSHLNPFLVFLAGVLPHGIFEIPAYLIASAFGLRITKVMVKTIVRSVRGDTQELDPMSPNSWRALFRDSVAVVLYVVILLVIAAFIESHVTPILLQSVLHRS